MLAVAAHVVAIGVAVRVVAIGVAALDLFEQYQHWCASCLSVWLFGCLQCDCNAMVLGFLALGCFC
jgi:hypothetical protein